VSGEEEDDEEPRDGQRAGLGGVPLRVRVRVCVRVCVYACVRVCGTWRGTAAAMRA
jgi:hypothetical protein